MVGMLSCPWQCFHYMEQHSRGCRQPVWARVCTDVTDRTYQYGCLAVILIAFPSSAMSLDKKKCIRTLICMLLLQCWTCVILCRKCKYCEWFPSCWWAGWQQSDLAPHRTGPEGWPLSKNEWMKFLCAPWIQTLSLWLYLGNQAERRVLQWCWNWAFVCEDMLFTVACRYRYFCANSWQAEV